MRISVAQLTRRPREVLALLDRGAGVIVTYGGKDVARLVPVDQEPRRRSLRDYPAFGMWADRENMKDPAAWLREQRRGRVLP